MSDAYWRLACKVNYAVNVMAIMPAWIAGDFAILCSSPAEWPYQQAKRKLTEKYFLTIANKAA